MGRQVTVEPTPIRFIGEEIEVAFDEPPALEKTPGCPNAFNWRNEVFPVLESISEWSDFTRRGRFARNMQPEHASVASKRGSWGVGRDYFRVRIEGGPIFELYYDRAPRDADRRKGGWFLFRELEEA